MTGPGKEVPEDGIPGEAAPGIVRETNCTERDTAGTGIPGDAAPRAGQETGRGNGKHIPAAEVLSVENGRLNLTLEGNSGIVLKIAED